MRDGTIVEAFNRLEAKVGHDLGLLVKNFAVVETRQKALEAALLDSRIGLFKLAFLQLLAPKAARWLVAGKHSALMKSFRDKQEAVAKAIVTEQKAIIRPVLAGLAALFLMVGCVPLAKHRRMIAVRDTINQGVMDRAADAERRAQYCEEQQVKLVEVLKKFNQVDDKGKLREKGVSYQIKDVPVRTK